MNLEEITLELEKRFDTVRMVERGNFTQFQLLSADQIMSADISDEVNLKAEVTTVEHVMVGGTGDTESAAILDWLLRFPFISGGELIWRVRPEIQSEVDYDTRKERFRVISRHAHWVPKKVAA